MALRSNSRRTPRFEESEDSVTEPLISQTNLNMNSSDKSTKLSTFFTSKQNIYSIYVLLLFLITYLLNQLDRYMLAIVTKPLAQEIHYGDQGCMTNTSATFPTPQVVCQKLTNESSCAQFLYNDTTFGGCKWDYTGQGFDYQILAGPIFILIYTFAAIPVGIAADLYNRKIHTYMQVLLGISLIFWSVCTLLSGFVTSYWQLALLRFGLGLGEAGCTPFATSLIADYFGQELRGLAMGVYNWGIYTGYSLSYALGNFITDANINNQGWRWSFIIAGIPGIVIGFIILLTVREPKRGEKNVPLTVKVEVSVGNAEPSTKEKFKQMFKLIRPSLLLLCIASSIRNAAGYVWAYNTQVYFDGLGQTPTQIGTWMSWIPVVGGSIGVVFGGFISDRVVKRTGPHGRIWVLALSQIISSPFAAGVLFLDPPYCYFSLLPNYIIGEMWVGVALAVLVELVPADVRTTAVAAYFFIISNIGGNMPLLVPPVKKAFIDAGYGEVDSLRNTLYLFFPGEYILGALLFLVSLVVLQRDIEYIKQQQDKKIETNEGSQSQLPSNYGSASTLATDD
ncbi:protein spinster homolog 1-like isoform X2 [Daphnia pulex]|uniref:protein spinster homolog 1-like isoform X2 n=1 Tax=Daphnia pulex TaxID=6669 RepID=UPI001EDD3BAE|nr:protein spinster homolog 1-like isoform X2 [Daphnia pulex]